MKREILATKLAPAAVGTYSQGVKHNGVWYFSGQIGLDLNGNCAKASMLNLSKFLKTSMGSLRERV